MSHLVDEALRLGATFVSGGRCPIDGAELDTYSKRSGRAGHLNIELNEWHVADVPKGEGK